MCNAKMDQVKGRNRGFKNNILTELLGCVFVCWRRRVGRGMFPPPETMVEDSRHSSGECDVGMLNA